MNYHASNVRVFLNGEWVIADNIEYVDVVLTEKDKEKFINVKWKIPMVAEFKIGMLPKQQWRNQLWLHELHTGSVSKLPRGFKQW